MRSAKFALINFGELYQIPVERTWPDVVELGLAWFLQAIGTVDNTVPLRSAE